MASTYDNSVFTCTSTSTPDPFVTPAGGKWYFTYTAGNCVEIWRSDSPTNFHVSAANKKVVWCPSPNSSYSSAIWAPELHALDGRWYIYVSCEDPKVGNPSHRMCVLGGPNSTSDPMSSNWEFLGPVQGLPGDQWAIDGTIVPLRGAIYFAYSGWPLGVTNSDTVQQLFIVRLKSPLAVDNDAGGPICICEPDQPWERSGTSAINEGPQFLTSPDGSSWVGLVYSCAGSWTPEYKMNTLRYLGGDPMARASWSKGTEPLLASRPDGVGPFGPGHGSFVSPTLGTVIAVFHATDLPTDGWENRKARAQMMMWTEDGPNMGGYVGPLLSQGSRGKVSKLLGKIKGVVRKLC